MSDLSALDQSFGLMPATMAAPLYEAPLSNDVQPHEVAFRQLKGRHEIARILHLRNEIQLPTSALSDQSFTLREKKETKSVSSGRSCGTAST